MRKLLLAGFLLSLLAMPGFAGDVTKLKIVVTNTSGKPVDHASVIVKFIEGHSIVKLGKAIRTSWEAHTSQEGVVELPEIPKGKILVQVIAKNYQTFGVRFDITEDQRTIDVTLAPPQAQYSAH